MYHLCILALVAIATLSLGLSTGKPFQQSSTGASPTQAKRADRPQPHAGPSAPKPFVPEQYVNCHIWEATAKIGFSITGRNWLPKSKAKDPLEMPLPGALPSPSEAKERLSAEITHAKLLQAIDSKKRIEFELLHDMWKWEKHVIHKPTTGSQWPWEATFIASGAFSHHQASKFPGGSHLQQTKERLEQIVASLLMRPLLEKEKCIVDPMGEGQSDQGMHNRPKEATVAEKDHERYAANEEKDKLLGQKNKAQKKKRRCELNGGGMTSV